MEAPKCKMCGERHYGICQSAAHIPSAVIKLKTDAPKRTKCSTAILSSKFDRAAYQRQYMRSYMRKWRAKQKAKSAT